MMLLKVCTQYDSKFGRFRRGHRTGRSVFIPVSKNVPSTAQLHSFHILAKQCSKFSKPGFNSMWTMNFQMLKLYLEKAEEPEIKWPTFTGSLKKQESYKKNHLLLLC